MLISIDKQQHSQTLSSEVNVLGGVSLRVLLLHALKECLFCNGTSVLPGPLKTVYRVEVRGKLYYSRQYQRVKKRNSFTVAYLDCNGLNKFEYFVFVCEQVIAVFTPLTPLSVSSKNDWYHRFSIGQCFLSLSVKNNSVECCFVQDIGPSAFV